jgi:hypothetical protein
MHVHNVSSYAPPGYRLARTEYEGGTTKHVFASIDDARREIALECAPADAAEEVGYLEKFRDFHTAMAAPLESHPVPAHEALGAIAAAHAPSAKPSRRRP